jgi:ABC-2 type transport system permease protein
MPLKKQSFNREIILQIGRNTGWVSILYFFGLLFTLPIQILIIYSKQNLTYEQHFDNLFRYNLPFQMGLMAIVPVLMAVFLFRFLQVKSSTDLMHSLPIKRERIFHHYALTGVVFLVIPVIMNAIIILCMHNILDIKDWFSMHDILYWTTRTIVITLLLYTAGVFIAMMTGISAVHAALTYIFLFFPVGMVLLLVLNLKIVLFGFPGDYFLNQQLEKMSPITYAAVLDTRTLYWGYVVLYMILTVLFYFLALIFYKKRNLEAASEAIVFPKLRAVFKYGAAFCTMLLGGAYFNEVSFKSGTWTVFGYVVGAAIGYIIAEMVLQKTWRIFTRIKGLLVYGAVVALFIIGLQTLGIYENRLPNEKDIKNVMLTESVYVNNDMYHYDFIPKPLKERGNIEAVRMLHNQILADRNINHGKNRDQTRTLYFIYELKNGSRVIREYEVNVKLYADFLKPVYESKEYKTASNQIFHLRENKIKNITLNPNVPVKNMAMLSDPKDINEFLSAVREDILEEKYEDSLYYSNAGPSIEINLGSHRGGLGIELKPIYQHAVQWLKQKDMLDKVMLSANDISHISITKVDAPDGLYDPEKIKGTIGGSGHTSKVTDRSQINELLLKGTSDPNHPYRAVISYKSKNNSTVMFYDEEHIPEFVKSEFN